MLGSSPDQNQAMTEEGAGQSLTTVVVAVVDGSIIEWREDIMGQEAGTWRCMWQLWKVRQANRFN